MYHSTKHVGSDGLEHDACIATKISVPEGIEIFNLCRNATRTLEIGLAYGFSTMYFLAANENSFHVAIDPFIEEWWQGVGLQNVRELGMSHRVRFMGDISLIALPKLIAESAKFDVLFVDGNHRFDDVLTDFALCSMLCEVGGHIILDDMWMPGIVKAANFIRVNRKDFEEVKTGVFNMCVFKKIAEDSRPWNHFEDFS
jgi:predicted O-methyltransferase YrrM